MSGGILGAANSLLFGAQPGVPNFYGLANQQTQANRPNQYTPYGQSEWKQDPATGAWTQNTGFSGALQGANDSLMTQWGKNAAAGYGNGDTARNQAVNASWGQFERMNEPLMAQRENKSKSDLLNMGLDAGSEGFNTGFGNTLRANDTSRLNAQDQAIAAGDRAQQQTFNQNRQSWMDPLSAMGAMQGLLQMPNVPGAGNYLQAGQDQFNAENTQYGQTMNNITGLLGGGAQVAGMMGGMPPGMGGAGQSTGWGGQLNQRGSAITQGPGNFQYGT